MNKTSGIPSKYSPNFRGQPLRREDIQLYPTTSSYTPPSSSNQSRRCRSCDWKIVKVKGASCRRCRTLHLWDRRTIGDALRVRWRDPIADYCIFWRDGKLLQLPTIMPRRRASRPPSPPPSDLRNLPIAYSEPLEDTLSSVAQLVLGSLVFMQPGRPAGAIGPQDLITREHEMAWTVPPLPFYLRIPVIRRLLQNRYVRKLLGHTQKPRAYCFACQDYREAGFWACPVHDRKRD